MKVQETKAKPNIIMTPFPDKSLDQKSLEQPSLVHQSLEQPPQEKKPFLSERTKKILKVIYMVLMIGYAFYSVYSAIAAFVKFKNITGTYLGIIDNWQLDMIKDIKAVTADTNCPADYKNIFNYEWPGTNEGCNCLSIKDGTKPPNQNITLNKKIYETKCNASTIAVGCSTIAPTAGVNMTSYLGYKYCVQRAKGTSFVETAKNMNDDGSCKTGFTKCGGNADPMNAVCIDPAQFNGGCPVMDIKSSQVNANYVRLGASPLYISTKADHSLSAMSEIYINEGGVCASSPGTTTTAGSPHPLMKSTIRSCNSYDNSYTSLGASIDKVSFFAAHKVLVSAVPELDKYVLTSQFITPFKRSYFGFKPICRMDVSRMSNSEGEVKTIQIAQSSLLAIAIIVGFILGIVFIILELIVIFECVDRQSRKCLDCCINSRLWLNPILKVIHIIILANSVAVSGKVKNHFSNLAEKNCGDAKTSANLKDLSFQISEYIFKQNRNSLIVTSIMIFIDFVMIIYKCFFQKKEDNNKTKVHSLANTNDSANVSDIANAIARTPQGP